MIPFSEQDKAIRVLSMLPDGRYPVKPSQVPMIKTIWEALHWYDKEYDYTMTEDWKTIIKRKL